MKKRKNLMLFGVMQFGLENIQTKLTGNALGTKMNTILKHYDNRKTVSMPDLYHVRAEEIAIKEYLKRDKIVADIGCGEGLSTREYCKISKQVIGFDFSKTRLALAKKNLRGCKNVHLKYADFTQPVHHRPRVDCCISQRFLINLPDWEQQKAAIKNMLSILRVGGSLVILEGTLRGNDKMNEIRELFGLEPIEVKWHNIFLDEYKLEEFMYGQDVALMDWDGIGDYTFLTRCIRPIFNKRLNWDCDFNKIAASREARAILRLPARFSRFKLWVYQKIK